MKELNHLNDLNDLKTLESKIDEKLLIYLLCNQ